MDPSENPSHPNAPGPPASSSQGGFQFASSPFGVPSFGQNATGPLFGQNVQFGGRPSSITAADRKPASEPVFNNPFASGKSASSIFGGRSGEQVGDTSCAVKPQTPVVKLGNPEETSLPATGASTMMAKPRFPPNFGSLFGGNSVEQTSGNIQDKTTTEIRQTTVTTVTTFSEMNEKSMENVPAELVQVKDEKRRAISKHPVLHSLVKDRIRNIITENRVKDEDEELANLQEMKESLLRKLAARKHEKKRKSSDSHDGSPGKITKEDKALYFTLPNDSFTKTLVKEHFSKFGDLSRVYLNTAKNHCIIHFLRHEDAVKAYENGSVINGCAVRLFWRNILRAKKKSESSKEGAADGKKTSKKPLLDMDPEVQEELAAMGGFDKFKPLDLPSKKPSKPSMTLRSSTRLKETSKTTKKARAELTSKEAESMVEKSSDGVTGDGFIEAAAGAQELIAIMKTAATSLEDRLRILEARDKLIRLGQVKQCDLAKAKKTVGACPDMCPEKERLLRETRRQVSIYEMDESSKRMNSRLAVKQYARSSADQEEPLPHELRPPPVMAMTMSYLLHCIADLCDRPGENLAEWYHYLWDRTRSIRKEITQQELCDSESVQLVEQCARFHIHCCARLVAEDVSVFDHRINTENLTKCLQTLKHMYYDLYVKHNLTCQNEAEFMSYFLLLNLNNGSVMWELEQLREDVLQTPEINFAAKLYMAINSNNFVRFFRLVRSASYLASCLAIRYFYQVRTLALRTHIKALNARNKPILYPLAALCRELAFEDLIEGEEFCGHHGLSVDHSQPEMLQVMFSRNTFRIATTVFAASRSLGLVESKRNCSVGEVIAGGELPPRTFDSHVPHDSFDANGILKESAWHAVDQGMPPSDLSFEEEFGNVSEKDSSATPSEAEIVQAKTEDPEPIITEHPKDVGSPSSVLQISDLSAPQISEVRDDKDVHVPVVEKKPAETKVSVVIQPVTSSPFSQPSQTKTIFGAASTTTTWMSQSGTTQLKSSFASSPKNTSDASDGRLPVVPVSNSNAQVRDVKPTPALGTSLFSKPFSHLSSFGGATAGGAAALASSAQSPFGRPTTSTQSPAVVSASQDIAAIKTSPFGGAVSHSPGERATRSTAPAIKKDTASSRTPAPKTTEMDRKSTLEAEAAAEKKREVEEKMRARLIEAFAAKLFQESLDKVVEAEIRQLAEESLEIAKDIAKKQKEELEKRAFELCETLMTEVLLEELEELVSEELNKAIEEREKVIRRITAKYFRRWLEKSRLSLSRKRAIENFPAGVTHLSVEEHAKRWGLPSLSLVQDFIKQNGFFARGIPKLAHSWTSLSSLVGKEVMLRYHEECRQLRWKHSGEIAFKVLVSVPNDLDDRSSRVLEWFVRNPQQLKHGSSFQDSAQGVIRYVTSYQIAPDVMIHSSLQLVRGSKSLLSNPELVAGTSAILFSMSLSENIAVSCERLEAILEASADLPAQPLVLVLFGSQRTLDADTLKALISNLGIYKKIKGGHISDYKILHVGEASDLQAVDGELRKVLSYMAQKWHPPQQFTVKPLRTVLVGAFDMFFLSLKCSLDRGLPNSKLINNPQILAELCNEFLKHIFTVLLRSRRESKSLCAPEIWPNIYRGAYSCFHDHPSYERHLGSLLSSMQIPKVSGWPPGDPSAFTTWLSRSPSIVSRNSDLIERWKKGSTWPQVLEAIPWIQVMNACMQTKFQESNMSGLCGTELYVVVDSRRLERLHNEPWWKHSRRLHIYLSEFEKRKDESVLVDISNRNKVAESSTPPLKKRCVDDKLLAISPDIKEISQIIEEHQQSLRNHNENLLDKNDGSPKISRLEMMIDDLQCRLGLGAYRAPTVHPEPKQVETRKQVVTVPQQLLQPQQLEKNNESPEKTEVVCEQHERSKEADKDKMRKILEAAHQIVAPLHLASGASKHLELVQGFLFGREKGDLSAAKIPLSVLSRSDFVERSQRDVEERVKLYKRCETPPVEEPEMKPESYDESSNSQSDSTSSIERRRKRKRSSDSSSFSEESPSSVDSYSLTSDEEKSVYISEDDEESMEYEENKENSIDCAIKVEVIRSSSDAKEEDELTEEEAENFEGEEEIENISEDEVNIAEGEEREEEEEDSDEEDERRCRKSYMTVKRKFMKEEDIHKEEDVELDEDEEESIAEVGNEEEEDEEREEEEEDSDEDKRKCRKSYMTIKRKFMEEDDTHKEEDVEFDEEEEEEGEESEEEEEEDSDEEDERKCRKSYMTVKRKFMKEDDIHKEEDPELDEDEEESITEVGGDEEGEEEVDSDEEDERRCRKSYIMIKRKFMKEEDIHKEEDVVLDEDEEESIAEVVNEEEGEESEEENEDSDEEDERKCRKSYMTTKRKFMEEDDTHKKEDVEFDEDKEEGEEREEVEEDSDEEDERKCRESYITVKRKCMEEEDIHKKKEIEFDEDKEKVGEEREEKEEDSDEDSDEENERKCRKSYMTVKRKFMEEEEEDIHMEEDVEFDYDEEEGIAEVGDVESDDDEEEDEDEERGELNESDVRIIVQDKNLDKKMVKDVYKEEDDSSDDVQEIRSGEEDTEQSISDEESTGR